MPRAVEERIYTPQELETAVDRALELPERQRPKVAVELHGQFRRSMEAATTEDERSEYKVGLKRLAVELFDLRPEDFQSD